MSQYARKQAWTAAVAIALAAVLAGCSGAPEEGASEPTASASDVTVSTPPDSPTPTPAASVSDQSDDFATAVEFTKLTHEGKQKEAGQLVVPESPAARYLAHQTLYQRAVKVSTGFALDREAPDLDPNSTKGTIKVSYAAAEGTPAISYTWKAFKFEGGKLELDRRDGPGEGRAVVTHDDRESRGRKAVLKSAYLSNTDAMVAVVELSSSVGTSFAEAEYTADDGYRQGVSEQGIRDLSADEKTLGYFVFEESEFGGRLHIPYYDEDGTAQGDWKISLAVK